MLSITGCADRARLTQVKPLTPDVARYGPCLDAKIALPTSLPALAPFTVPAGQPVVYGDGTIAPLKEAAKVVLLSTVNGRDEITTRAYLSERAARQTCQSAVQYSVDWIGEVTAAASGKSTDGR